MALTAIKQFEVDFLAALNQGESARDTWLDLSMRAPEVFGVHCFVPKAKGEERHPDAQALRDTCIQAYAATVGGMPDAPKRDDKSAKANDARAKRNSIQTVASVYMARMQAYQAGFQKPKAKLTLEAWAKRILGQCTGKKAIIKNVPSYLIEALKKAGEPTAKAESNVITMQPRAAQQAKRVAVRKAA